MRPKYVITNSLCVLTGSADTPMGGIKLIYKQLRESPYAKDSRTLSVLGDGGVYTSLGTFELNNGRIQWSLEAVKHWREHEKQAGRDYSLDTYYKELDLCPKCKGNQGYCNCIQFKLVVREQIGVKMVDLPVESGSLAECLKCFKEIRGAYNGFAQFRIEASNGKILGIQVKDEILWLPNVPAPREKQYAA
jgi:hypothetical protein